MDSSFSSEFQSDPNFLLSTQITDVPQNKLIEIEEEDDDNQYEIRQILNKSQYDKHRKVYKYFDKIDRDYPTYLISWKGYPDSDNSWNPLVDLRGCIKTLEYYEGDCRKKFAKIQLDQKMQQQKKQSIKQEYNSQAEGLKLLENQRNRYLIQIPQEAKILSKQIDYPTGQRYYKIQISKRAQVYKFSQLDRHSQAKIETQYEDYHQKKSDDLMNRELNQSQEYFNQIEDHSVKILQHIQRGYQFFDPLQKNITQYKREQIYDFKTRLENNLLSMLDSQDVQDFKLKQIYNLNTEQLKEKIILIVPLEMDVQHTFLNVAANLLQQCFAPIKVKVSNYNDIGRINLDSLKVNEILGKISYGGEELCSVLRDLVVGQLGGEDNILRVIGIMKHDVRDEGSEQFSFVYSSEDTPYTIFSLARFQHIVYKPDFFKYAHKLVQQKVEKKYEYLSDQLNDEHDLEKKNEILEKDYVLNKKCYISKDWVTHIDPQINYPQKLIIKFSIPLFLGSCLTDIFGLSECIYKNCCLNPTETCEDIFQLNLLPCPLCVLKLQLLLKFDIIDWYKRLYQVIKTKQNNFSLKLQPYIKMLKNNLLNIPEKYIFNQDYSNQEANQQHKQKQQQSLQITDRERLLIKQNIELHNKPKKEKKKSQNQDNKRKLNPEKDSENQFSQKYELQNNKKIKIQQLYNEEGIQQNISSNKNKVKQEQGYNELILQQDNFLKKQQKKQKQIIEDNNNNEIDELTQNLMEFSRRRKEKDENEQHKKRKKEKEKLLKEKQQQERLFQERQYQEQLLVKEQQQNQRLRLERQLKEKKEKLLKQKQNEEENFKRQQEDREKLKRQQEEREKQRREQEKREQEERERERVFMLQQQKQQQEEQEQKRQKYQSQMYVKILKQQMQQFQRFEEELDKEDYTDQNIQKQSLNFMTEDEIQNEMAWLKECEQQLNQKYFQQQ